MAGCFVSSINVDPQTAYIRKQVEYLMELVELRAENAKTFDLGGNKRGLLVHIGAIHYKDNYADPNEAWKDIDLTWEGNRITKAPYELTLEGQKLTIRDKKSGEVSTIELLSVFPAGLNWEVIPENSAIRFRHTFPSDKIPFEAKFKVTGNIPFLTRAFDAEGEIPLETSLIDGVLTEKLFSLPRLAKGNIRVDPTWQVGASTDDAMYVIPAHYWSIIEAILWAGWGSANYAGLSGVARFLNVTIPAGSTITLANLKLIAYESNSKTVVKSRLRAEANINPATFSTEADFLARTWTTAYVNWDAIPAWTAETEYTSSDIKTSIQEVIGLSGWTSGNPMAVLWDDFENRTTQVAWTTRAAYSYNGSTTKAPKLYVEYTLPYPGYTDTATRFLLEVRSFNDISTRFLLWATSYVDTATRFLLFEQGYSDTSTRFHIAVVAPAGVFPIIGGSHIINVVGA